MRPRSIGGPIIMIAVGVIFLIDNLRPDLSLWALFGQYWPFLLIGFGVLRLAEILLSAQSSRPLLPHGLRGGEWLLAGLICVFGTGAYFSHRHFSPVRHTILRDFDEPSFAPPAPLAPPTPPAPMPVDNPSGGPIQ